MSSVSGVGGPGSKMVCDMDDHGEHHEMKNDAFKVAAQAIEANQEEKDISKHIKVFFDQKYGPTWHCIVGGDFRAYVTHESKHFIFFYVGKIAICLYKS
jgi:dynein light chain LC8-type